MAVVFGEKQKGGWLRVTQISYGMDEHPNGHTVKTDKIPQYPQGGSGIGYIQMFNPKTKKFRYDEIKVPFTNEEALLEIATAIRELAAALKGKKK